MLTPSVLKRTGLPWILVVDRDEDEAASLVRLFQHRGFGAHAASVGHDAVSVARLLRPTLAVIDVGPATDALDMAGLDVARRLRALDPELLLVMTTSAGHSALEIEARKLGIVYYAHKPVDLEQIDAVVTKAITAQRGSRHDP